MKINDFCRRIPCEMCKHVYQYPDLCGDGRRCGILVGTKLTLPFTSSKDYDRVLMSQRQVEQCVQDE